MKNVQTRNNTKMILFAMICIFIVFMKKDTYASVITGNCGQSGSEESVKYTLDTDTGNLLIYANSTGDCYMKDFTNGSTAAWRPYKDYIKSVTITGRVMNIGEYAFIRCVNLTSVSIPNAVIEEIGSYAFYNCKDLVNFKSTQGKVLLPSSVDTIGQYAFNNCFHITQVQMNSNVSTLQNGTFKDCTSMSLISINSAVTYISGMCFRNCSSLTGVSLPSGLTYLGSQAFMDCSGLLNITIPQYVPDLHYQAFKNCTSMQWISYKTGTNISSTAFEGCSSSLVQIPY